MPFIDCKITKEMTETQKDALKTELGKAAKIIHKPESYLMVGIDDNYTLYMGGKKLDAGAFISVSLFGSASPSDYEKMTAELCKIMQSLLSIPPQNVYITYTGVKDWGWNGNNF